MTAAPASALAEAARVAAAGLGCGDARKVEKGVIMEERARCTLSGGEDLQIERYSSSAQIRDAMCVTCGVLGAGSTFEVVIDGAFVLAADFNKTAEQIARALGARTSSCTDQ